jgi:hypothetical protein
VQGSKRGTVLTLDAVSISVNISYIDSIDSTWTYRYFFRAGFDCLLLGEERAQRMSSVIMQQQIAPEKPLFPTLANLISSCGLLRLQPVMRLFQLAQLQGRAFDLLS